MCGIFGIIANYNCRNDVLVSLTALAHRGQDATGVTVLRDGQAHTLRVAGNVNQLFAHREELENMYGRMFAANARFITTGMGYMDSAQPFISKEPLAALVHNGQIDNMRDLESILRKENIPVHSDSDSELLLSVLMLGLQKRADEEAVFDAVRFTQQHASGGYACIVPIAGVGLLAFRDPWGLRPLSMATRTTKEGTALAFASEEVAFRASGYTFLGDVDRGEAVLVRPDLTIERRVLIQKERANCAFEGVYFANPTSLMDGIRVESVRRRLGKRLAKYVAPLLDQIDIVVPIPNAPRAAAQGFCDETGLPYRELIQKPLYAPRVYLADTQKVRGELAETSFQYFDGFEGKRVLVIDDSIVRGTNSQPIIQRIRSMGATQVHLAITFPPIRERCRYGVNMQGKLAAKNNTTEQIRLAIGADSLVFTTEEDVREAYGHPGLCLACVNADFPTDLYQLGKTP